MTLKEMIRATEFEISREAAARRMEYKKRQTEKELRKSGAGGVVCRLGNTSCDGCMFWEPITWHCLYHE